MSGWGGLDQILEDARRRREEDDAEEERKRQESAMQNPDYPYAPNYQAPQAPVQGPPRQLEIPSMRPQIDLAPSNQPTYGVSRPATDTGTPGLGESYYGPPTVTQREEDPYVNPYAATPNYGSLQPGQQGPQLAGADRSMEVNRSGINLAGIVQPTGLAAIDYMLGLEPDKEPERPGWMKWVEDAFSPNNLDAAADRTSQFFTEDIPDWYAANPGSMYAEDKAATRQRDLESGETGKKAAAWSVAGELLVRQGFLPGVVLGSIIQWANKPENLQGRNEVLRWVDQASEMGLAPATTPFNQLDVWNGAGAYDNAPGPSLASILAPIGAGANRAFNPLNPNQNDQLWGSPKQAKQATQGYYDNRDKSLEELYRNGPSEKPWGQEWIDQNLPLLSPLFQPADLGDTYDERKANLQKGLAQLGVTDISARVDTDSWLGRFFNAAVWSGDYAMQEFSNIDSAMQIIHQGAKIDPKLAMFGRNVWSGSEKTLNAYNTAFSRGATIADLNEQYLEAQASGRYDESAMLYSQMQETANKSFSEIMEENQNPWAEIIAGVFFDVGPTGWLGDKVGDVIKGGLGAIKKAQLAKVFDITDEVAFANIDTALANSTQLIQKITGASDASEIKKAWQEIVKPMMGAGERVADSTWVLGLKSDAKAEVDTDILLRTFRWVFKDVTTKEDALRVMQALIDDPRQLVNGMNGFNSPGILEVSPEGFLQWGAGVVGNTQHTRRYPILKLMRDQLVSMDSLKGTGRINGEAFISEAAGILFDGARTVNGVDPIKNLPFGAASVRLITESNGMGRYEYLNAKGGRIRVSQSMPIAEAQQFVQSATDGMTLGKFGKVILSPVKFTLDIQKKLMSDTYLFYRPANWVRNALSGTAMLVADDMHGAAKASERAGWFAAKVGAGDPFGTAGDMQGHGFSGLLSPIVNRLLGEENPLAKAVAKVPDIAYGDTSLGNIPVGEKALRGQAAYRKSYDAVNTIWGRETKQVAAELNQMGLDGKIVDQFVRGLHEVGLRGSKQDVIKYVRDFAESGRFRLSLSELGLADDVLSQNTYTAISKVLNGHDLTQWEDAARQIRKAVAAQRKQPLQMLADTPKQLGDFKWMKEHLPTQAEKIAELRRRYLIRSGVDPATAAKTANQTADQFLASNAKAFDSFREALRDNPNNPNSWAVASDYYNEFNTINRRAQKAVDDLAREANVTGDWNARDNQARAIYDQLSKDIEALGRKYKVVLGRTKAGQPYEPVTKGWGQVLEEHALFDQQWFEGIKGYKVAGTDDAKYALKIKAWRQYVENGTAQMAEAFRMFPSADNFDIMTQTMEELGVIGKHAVDKVTEARQAMIGRKLSSQGYYNISNTTWEQAFGYMSAHAQATARAMVAHSVMSNTSESLRFSVKGQDFYLYGPKNGTTWYGIAEKTGKVMEFDIQGAGGTNPVIPQAMIDEYMRLTNGRANVMPDVGNQVVTAAAQAVPTPKTIPHPRVNVEAPASTGMKASNAAAAKKLEAAGKTAKATRKGKVRAVASANFGRLDPTEGMSHEEMWNNYGAILEQYGYTRRQMQVMTEDELRWAIQDAAATKPPEFPRGVDTGQYYGRPNEAPAPTQNLRGWGTPDSATEKELYGYNFGSQSKGEPKWGVSQEDELYGYAPGDLPSKVERNPQGDEGLWYRGEGAKPEYSSRGYEEFGPEPWNKPLRKQADPYDEPSPWDNYAPLNDQPVPRTTEDDWVAPALGRKAHWDRTVDDVYVDQGQPYLRMKMAGGGKLFPPGVDHLQGSQGVWVKAESDAYYIIPVQPEELKLTPAGMRKKNPDIVQDGQDFVAGKLLDREGRFPGDPLYQPWSKTANQPLDTKDWPAVTPTDNGRVVRIAAGTKLEEAFKGLIPDELPKNFDGLQERWRLPEPQDRRINRDKVGPETMEFTLKAGKGQTGKTTPIELVAQKRQGKYVVTFGDGALASGTEFNTFQEAVNEADRLIKEGVGIGPDGYIVEGKGFRRRLPEMTTTIKGKEASRQYLEKMTPEQILQKTFLDSYKDDPNVVEATGLEILRQGGFTPEEISSWVADTKNGRRKMLDALETALGMRSATVQHPQGEFFYGGLPIPPEVLKFFKGLLEDGVRALGADIAGGIGFSQRTSPFRGISVSDLALHELTSLDEIEQHLTDPAILQTILGGIDGKVDASVRGKLLGLADRLGSQHDNTVAQAFTLAEDAVNWAMLDFRKQRNIDGMFGFLAPFSFFVTRMPGRAAMALLKKPSLLGLYHDSMHAITVENEGANLPPRLEGSLPIPGTDLRVQVKHALTDLIPGMAYVAGDSYTRPEDVDTNGEAVINALDSTVPLGPLQRLILDWSSDNKVDEPLVLGSYLPIWRMAKQAQQGITGRVEQQGILMGGTMYDSGITQRNINANLGVGTDIEAYARSLAEADAEGKPYPVVPQAAQELYTREARETGWEMFWASVSAYLFAPVHVYGEDEQKSVAMTGERQSIRYNEGANPAGSRAGVRLYDKDTNDEAADYLSYSSAYKPETTAESVYAQAQNTDLEKRKAAIYEKYDAQMEDFLDGRDINTISSDEYYDFVNQQRPLLDAEIKAAEEALPLGANYKFPKGVDRYKAENPAELQTAAYAEAKSAAEDALKAQGIAKPEQAPEGSTYEQQRIARSKIDQFNAQVDALAEEYVRDPQWVQAHLGGRDPKTGKKAVSGAQTYQPGSPVGADAAKYPGGLPSPSFGPRLRPGNAALAGQVGMSGSFTPDPDNPYVDKMMEQEKLYGLPTGILQEVARHESNFNPDAHNASGADGLFQFMPSTWDEVAGVLGLTDPRDPEQATEAAAYYLDWINSQLSEDKRNSVFWMVAAYNSGVGAINPMTKPEDILTLKYTDKEARLAYATEIANAIGTPSQPAAGGLPAGQFISPIPSGADIYQEYGANVANYQRWNGEYGHEGIDYAVPVGTPVAAAATGTVEFAGTGAGFDNYGNYVVIRHGDGTRTYYAHLDSFDVAPGDTVEQGQQIALSGNSGRSDGPHLHFGVQQENAPNTPYGMVDPLQYLSSAPPQQSVSESTRSNSLPLVAQSSTMVNGVSLPSAVPFGNQPPTSMAGYRDQQSNTYNSPREQQIKDRFAAETQAGRDFAAKTYPNDWPLYDQYKSLLLDEERKAFQRANPQVKAVRLAAEETAGYQAVEKKFGTGAVMKWALVPESEKAGGQAGATTAYYFANPDAFAIKSYINGRPKPYVEGADFEGYDFGKDYAEAERLFGGNIWGIVQGYYSQPGGDSPEARKARAIYHEQNPVYDAFKKWWYGLLEQTEQFASAASYGGYRGSGGSGSGSYQSFEQPMTLEAIRSRGFEMARARRSGVDSGGWRKWLALANQK